MTINNFWHLLAGLGIFLFGMFQLEDSLKNLAGRTFKLFLKKHTDNKFSAILSGTLVTGVLQSSSVVTMMVLSFVGAKVLSMRNALAVVFGSNLGTTLDSWVVASLGFKYNIENFAFPIVGIAGMGLVFFSGKKRIYEIFKFLMGFGLLFLGLSFMKESAEVIANNFDFTPYLNLHKVAFVLLGFVITAIIQSSSATMVITLSALNSGVIPFEASVAIIVGSELGTSIKVLLGSIGGIAAKKCVAFGNIIFNIIITVFAYLLMNQIIWIIKNTINISDPLIGLVMFQSIINLLGIILFFPFIDKFGNFLEKFFLKNEKEGSYFIRDVDPKSTEKALEALEKETLLFIYRVVQLNLWSFHIDSVNIHPEKYLEKIINEKNNQFKSRTENYNNIKKAEGEILTLFSKMEKKKIKKENLVRLNQLIASVKNAMYAAKGIKDIGHDRKDLHESVIDIKYEEYKFIKKQLKEFYTELGHILELKENASLYKELVKLMEQIQKDHELRIENIYA